MSSNGSMAYVNNLKDTFLNDFDEAKEMDYLVHSCKMARHGKQLRQTTKFEKEYSESTKYTPKKSKNPCK